MINVSISFQNKVLDKAIEYYNDDKILLTSSDINSLKVKYGSYVMIEASSNLYILSKAWPYNKLSKGSAILNKLWSPNFNVQNKKQFKILPISKSIKNLVCSEIICTLCIKENNTKRNDLCSSISFKEVIKSMLMNALITKDILLGLTYHAESVVLKIEHILSPTITVLEDSVNYYLINEHTKIQIAQQQQSSADALADHTRLSHNTNGNISICEQSQTIVTSIHSDKQYDLEQLKILINRSFVGYNDEINASIETCYLGTTYTSSSFSSSTNPIVIASSSSSIDSNKAYIWTQINRPPKGLILYGPPGTGKTTLMHSLISALGCHSIMLSHSILLSCYEGEAEKSLQKVFQEAESLHGPCCILIDNMDLLCVSRNNIHASHIQRRVVACLLTLIDGHHDNNHSNSRVFIIGTTSKINDIDPAIRRAGRIDREIEIGVPLSTDRQIILEHLLKKCYISSIECIDNKIYSIDSVDDTDMIIKNIMKDISDQAHGMVGSDLLQVVKEAYYITMKSRYDSKYHSLDDFINDNHITNKTLNNDTTITNLTNDFNDITFIEDQKPPSINIELQLQQDRSYNSTSNNNNVLSVIALKTALKRISPSALREVVIEVPAVRWTDIGGMHAVKQSLKEVVELPLQQPHIFKSLGILPPKGVLLYGPPGCSKTLMAKALATESSMNFMTVRGPELLSKWLGESEKAIQTLFRRARAAAPSIIFFDEIDALACKRGDVSAGVSDRVLSQLLTELDGVQGLQHVIVIAATNRPDMLDPALIRPGRIDRKIYVPPPDEESRRQILSLELNKMPLQQSITDSDYTQLVQLTSSYSGAEIVAACSEAAMIAIEMNEVTLSYQHILTAIQAIKPQITREMLEFYKKCSEKL